jgi:hypothetical protein
VTPEVAAWLAEAEPQLLTLAGGFLRNTRRLAGVTCPLCAGMPGQGWTECRDCRAMMLRDDLSDRIAFVTYGVKGQQSGHIMHGYKNPHPGPNQQVIVQMLLGITLLRHRECFTSPSHGRPTHWAVVPSLSGRGGEHPLEVLLAPIMKQLSMQPLAAAEQVQFPRSVRPENFATPPLDGEHVLLCDDTWARGGHVQSAAGALKLAGAGYVTTLVLARWIDPAFDNAAAVLRDHLNDDYNPELCPFTGSSCPM